MCPQVFWKLGFPAYLIYSGTLGVLKRKCGRLRLGAIGTDFPESLPNRANR